MKQVYAQAQVYIMVYTKVGNQVWNRVVSQVWNEVGNRVVSQVWNQVRRCADEPGCESGQEPGR